MVERRIFDATRAAHRYDAALLEERCSLCGEPAAHRVLEDLTSPFQPIANYLCCAHFSWVLGDCATYPYDLPLQRGEARD